MQLWIDDTQLESVESIEAAFEVARKHADELGRLIIDIRADGRPIEDTLIDEPPTDDAGVSELRLTTTDHAAFLIETANSAKEALELTRADQAGAADLLRTGELEPAIELLQSVLEGWHAVRDIVEQTAALGDIDLDTLVATDQASGQASAEASAGTTGAQCAAQLSGVLAQVRTELTKQDWSSLGDAIEYDLDEQATRWDALLDAIIRRVRSGS